MKIFLLKASNIHEKHIDSLKIATQFYKGNITIYSDYPLYESPPENVSHIVYESTKSLLATLSIQEEPVLVAHSETIFIADCLNELVGANHHFGQKSKVMIQLPIHTVLLVQPRPTLPLYGSRRFWLSGTQLFTNQDNPIPVAYGDAKILYKYINGEVTENHFHDGIFHGGDTLLITAFPPLAFDNRFEEVPTFALASLDQPNYIANIPTL